MILYFTGTGNSEYTARRIGSETGDEVVNLTEKIKKQDFKELHSGRTWVITAPAYAWRIPHIVHEWLEKTTLSGSRDICFVMTCGGRIGNSGNYLRKLCEAKHMNYKGCYPIVMPNNYIVMGSTSAKKEALEIIAHSEKEIDSMISLLKKGQVFPQRSPAVGDRLLSSLGNMVFYPAFVHTKKFYAKDTCISCRKCADVCPMNNIRIENGKPVWGKDCTHCMACINRCPNESIEYGKTTRGVPRYICPK